MSATDRDNFNFRPPASTIPSSNSGMTDRPVFATYFASHSFSTVAKLSVTAHFTISVLSSPPVRGSTKLTNNFADVILLVLAFCSQRGLWKNAFARCPAGFGGPRTGNVCFWSLSLSGALRRLQFCATNPLLLVPSFVQPFAVLGQSTDELSMLRLRVKDIESVSARDGHSVFSWRLAGLLTASSASLTTPYLLPEDLNAAKQLLTACSADISTLCADSQQVRGSRVWRWFRHRTSLGDDRFPLHLQAGPSSFPPDVFHTNIGNMKVCEVPRPAFIRALFSQFSRNFPHADPWQCLEQSFTSVSDACVDAAHVANDYMRQNKE